MPSVHPEAPRLSKSSDQMNTCTPVLPPSNCCFTLKTCEIAARIAQWLSDRAKEGCAVRVCVTDESGSSFGVAIHWQAERREYSEFKDCIDMQGHEFSRT